MEKKYDHIIVGASKAGLSAAEALRQNRPADSILIVNGEDRLPYKRTHLTKRLADGFAKEEFALFPREWYREKKIDLLNHTRAVRIDPDDRLLKLSNGEEPAWGRLLIATGARPMRLPIPGMEHALHLREAAETEAIRKKLMSSRHVVILGQGVEGVELAEQCRRMGCEVTVSGKDGRLIQRWINEDLSRRLLALFQEKGIRCRFHKSASFLTRRTEGGKTTYLLNSQGEEISADLILCSTGIRAAAELTEPLGIGGAKGILANEYLETACPGIYAAGDVLELPEAWIHGLWHSAENQGRTAGLNMAGVPTRLEDKPARMKCEVFGDFYFSMCLSRVRESDQETGWKGGLFWDEQGRYLKLFVRRGRTIAGLMAGFKAGAKTLERGIAGQTEPQELIRSLQKIVEIPS